MFTLQFPGPLARTGNCRVNISFIRMKLGIVTDSTSDLPQQIIDEHEIEVVPAVLVLD